MVTQLVRVPASIESLVHFVEETDPADMLSATVAKLQAGVSSRDLLAAAALAVTRSTDLPPGHHGGPMQPLAASALPETAYRGGTPGRVPHQWLDEPHMIAATQASFLKARGFSGLVEHHLLWLLPRIPHGDLRDLLLTDAIPKN